MQTDQKPRIPYWHLWTDADGVSRQTRCFLTEFELQSISRPAQPQWQGHRTRAEVTVMMTVLPVGWVGEWHENPKPQWILPLSGRWFVESMDGQRVEMGSARSRSEPTRTRGKRAAGKAISLVWSVTSPPCSC